jgi:hypothetical protein
LILTDTSSSLTHFLVPLTIAESFGLGNPTIQRNAIDNLKILVIDNIFVLGKMVRSGIRVNADDSPISIRDEPSGNLVFNQEWFQILLKKLWTRPRIIFSQDLKEVK